MAALPATEVRLGLARKWPLMSFPARRAKTGLHMQFGMFNLGYIELRVCFMAAVLTFWEVATRRGMLLVLLMAFRFCPVFFLPKKYL